MQFFINFIIFPKPNLVKIYFLSMQKKKQKKH